jgi:hypothetical protein
LTDARLTILPRDEKDEAGRKKCNETLIRIEKWELNEAEEELGCKELASNEQERRQSVLPIFF